jgi:hypothetical protein
MSLQPSMRLQQRVLSALMDAVFLHGARCE